MLALMATISLWIYRIVLRLALLIVVPIIVIRDRMTGKRRPTFRERMGRDLPAIEPGGIWIHAVSVGEVEVARRLLIELGRRGDLSGGLLTATTATGLDLARRTAGGEVPVVLCPLDLPGPVSRVLDAARPRLVVLVETEIWPELIHQSGRRRVPVMVVNGRLSETSVSRYRRIAPLLRPLLEPVDRVAVRDSADSKRFSDLGVRADRIRVVGNIKYDLEPDPLPLEWEPAVRELAGDRPIVVVGSTMEGEEEPVLDGLVGCERSGHPVFTVLAPRHPERFDAVASLLSARGIPAVRRSRLDVERHAADVLLLDTIGELSRAFGLGVAAFVGGSLVPTGGHNPLEPAVWGVPVLSGPHIFNFEEVYREMVTAGGARLVSDAGELAGALASWLSDSAAARDAGEAGRAVVEANRGATARTVDEMLDVMNHGASEQ
jgi:3-deoxy-D-manno-octulosonic-acid transferase